MLEDIIYSIKVVKLKWPTYKNILLDIEPIYTYINIFQCCPLSKSIPTLMFLNINKNVYAGNGKSKRRSKHTPKNSNRTSVGAGKWTNYKKI